MQSARESGSINVSQLLLLQQGEIWEEVGLRSGSWSFKLIIIFS
jgi:hypothetical protein